MNVKKILLGILVCFIATGLAAQQVEIYPQIGPQGNSRISFSPDGKWILSGVIYDAATGRELKRPFNGSIIDWSPDMKRYLEGIGNTVRVRDWETDAVLLTLRNVLGSGWSSESKSIGFSPDGRQIAAITSNQENIKVWDASNGQELVTITTDSESIIRNFCYSSDGRSIFFRDSRTVKVFDLVNRRQLRSFSVVGAASERNIFSPDRRRYIVATSSGSTGNQDVKITIYNTETGSEIRTLTGHNTFVVAMAYRPDGRQIVSVDRNNVMKVWDAETGRELRSTNLEHDFYYHLAYSPDGRRLALNPSNRIIVLDTENYREVLAINFITRPEISLSPNGKYIAVDAYRTIRVLNQETGRVIQSFSRGNLNSNTATFAWSNDGNRLSFGHLAGERSHQIRTVDIETGRQLSAINNQRWIGIDSISYSPDGSRMIQKTIGSIDLWDVANNRVLFSEYTFMLGTLETPVSIFLRAIAWRPNSRQVLVQYEYYASNESAVKILDSQNGNVIRTFTHDMGRIVSYSPDGRRILSTSNGIARLWDAETGREVQGAPRHEGLRQIEYSPDGRQIVTSGGDGFIRAWNTANNTQLWEYNARDDRLARLYYSTDGKRIIAVTNFSREVRILDSTNGQLLFSRSERIASISPDGKWIITVSQDGTVRIWSAETFIEKAQFIAFDDGEWLSMTPDGFYVASSRGDQYLNARVGNTVTGIDRYRSTFNKPAVVAARLSNTSRMTHNETIVSVSVNPAGTRIASVSQNLIKIWDLESGRELRTITNIGGHVNTISWSPDGRRLIHGAEDSTIRIWNAETGAAISTIRGYTAYVNEARYSPDGRRIASCAADKLIKIWDAETGREIRTLSGHTDSVGVGVIAWSPDGRRLASGSVEEEKTIRIWDVESGRVLHTITNQGGRIWGLAYSSDGKTIASCTPEEQAVKIWDAENGRLIRNIPIENSKPFSLSWSPDGRRLAVGNIYGSRGVGYVFVCDVETGNKIHDIRVGGIPQSVTWTPDGRRIVSTSNFSDIQMIKVFDALSGRELY